jgi:hypothetical protein
MATDPVRTLDDGASLTRLRTDFLATSTVAMPLAGLLCWSALGVAALRLEPATVGTLALYIIAAILPVAFLLDRARGRNPFSGGRDNPLTTLFLLSIVGIGLTVPLVIAAAEAAAEPDLLVLGMAILAGVVWIPYGWAAGDPVGLRHAVARGLGCYVAYAAAPASVRAAVICGVVAAAYGYSLTAMKRPGPA